MKRIPVNELVDFGVRLLKSKGLPEPSALYCAQIAVTAEAMGIDTHGLALLGHLNSLLGKKIDPAAEPVIGSDKGAAAAIDGNRAPGPLAMKAACALALEKARSFGIGMVTVNNTFWLGPLGVYLVPVAEKGMMAQAWAQSSTCRDCAPVGGIDARFSTNPMALAFPAGDGMAFADFSTAAVSMGKVGKMISAGEEASEPIFMDADGNYTTDPKVVKEGGSILFTGGRHHGHKGYGLSLWCEALTALAGGDCNNPEADGRQSFAVLVIDPEAFAGNRHYLAETERFIRHLKSSRLTEDAGEIRLPGERALRQLRDSEENGVPVGGKRLKQIHSIAEENGIEPPSVPGEAPASGGGKEPGE